ncbi:MAG TPA: hypothetical protein VJA19_19260 [Pseudomonas sp.]|nr:hypothetical protein [Pseudomonas sp.]
MRTQSTQLAKPLCAVLMLALAGCATHSGMPAQAGAPESLQGRWKNVSATIYWTDGRVTAKSDLHCTSEISQSQSVSECLLPNGSKSQITSKILSPTPTSYTLEIIEDNVPPSNVGSRVQVEYVILEQKLHTTVYSKPDTALSPEYSIDRLETVSVRE